VSLAEWYAAHGRHELPWRADRDRWSVLVSEVMLHQTQVARVAAAWTPFIARFPDAAAMAAAGPGAVIEAWGRLGYPRRARRLWEAAVHVTQHGWPDDLTQLPGVGRYTAGAVRCQADGVDVPAVDVNIRRVVASASDDRSRDATVCSRSWISAHSSAGRARPTVRRARSAVGVRPEGHCRTKPTARAKARSPAASVSAAGR
jgi:A/G-specific adenine glycosylase